MINRIGILGGMGPKSATYFLQLLIRVFSDTYHPAGRQDYPDITLLMENALPSLGRASPDESRQASQKVNRAIASLILSGCDPVVIPSIATHALVEQRWFDAGVIDFRKLIIDHFETAYTDKVAVLAADGVIASDVFLPLQDHFDLYYPTESQQKKITSILEGPQGLGATDINIDACKSTLEKILMDCRKYGVEYFLAGAADIETFVSTQGVDEVFILPMELMCEDVIDRIRSETVPG